MRDGREQRIRVGIPPPHRVAHDDRGGEPARTVVRRHIDDRGREPVGEQQVLGEVAVDDLRRRRDRRPHREQPRKDRMRDGRRELLPRDAIPDRPRVRAQIEERRSRQRGDRRVETLAGLDHVDPPFRLGTRNDRLAAPPVDHPSAVGGAHRQRQPEPVLRHRGQHLAEPRPLGLVVARFEDDVGNPPAATLATPERHGLADGAEGIEHGWRRAHARSYQRGSVASSASRPVQSVPTP